MHPTLRRLTAIGAVTAVLAAAAPASALPSAMALSGSTTALTAFAPAHAAALASIRGERSSSAIPGSYVIKLRDTESLRREGIDARAGTLARAHRATLGQVWRRAAVGFHATMSRDDAVRLASDPSVEYVMQDQYLANADPASSRETVAPSGTQTPAPWGLDRIDQHALPLDNHYNFDDSAGEEVNAYILSTGIAANHPDFGGRVIAGPSFISDGRPSTADCHGAGTKIAGLVGGAQHGVAKNVTFVSVRDSGCNNITSTSLVVSSFDWVIENAVTPAVVLFLLLPYCVHPQTGAPLACAPDTADIVVNAQESAFAAGLTVFGAAGDLAQDTCANATGAAPDTVYVGATTSGDARAGYSNFGPCVTMFAPGDSVSTDSPSGGSTTVSSSAAAAAYVAGAAALFAGKPEFDGASPTQIRDELVRNRSTPNVVTGLPANSPNRLLFTGPPGFFTVGESASLAPRSGGGLELFGANSSARIQYRDQNFPSGPWTPWTHSKTKGWLSVAAEPNHDDRLALLGLTGTGEMWLREETSPGSSIWSNWARVSPAPGSSPIARATMASNLSNQLQIFATTHSGQAYHRSQLSPGSRQWSAWMAFSFAGKLRCITAIRRGDGRIEVFAIDDAGSVWRAAQTSPTGNSWSSFTKLSGSGMASVAAARHASGNLELIGLDAGGGAWRRSQNASGTWTDWTRLPTRTLARVTAETRSDGRIQLVGVDNLGDLWQSLQTSPSTATYTPWIEMDGQLRP